MLDLIKKSMLAGIGLAVVGKEKAEELVDQVCQQANVSREEGEKVVKETLDAAEEARQEMEDRIKKALREQLEKLDLATKADVETLAARVTELENKTQ